MYTETNDKINPLLLQLLQDPAPEELMYIQHLTRGFPDNDIRQFVSLYERKRKSPQTILICCLLGFVLFAGIQRFVTKQIGMGILYFFTGGLCLVGTIIDIINHNTIALEYNKQMIAESIALMRMR
ncbi:MAG: TM2 domain-containing protein [Ferruginibacter sp.]